MKIFRFLFAALFLSSLTSCDSDIAVDWYEDLHPVPPPPGVPSFSFNVDGERYEAVTMLASLEPASDPDGPELPVFYASFVDSVISPSLKLITYNSSGTDIMKSDSVEVIYQDPIQPEKSFHLVSKNKSFEIEWGVVQAGYLSGQFRGTLYAPGSNRKDSVTITDGIFLNVEM